MDDERLRQPAPRVPPVAVVQGSSGDQAVEGAGVASGGSHEAQALSRVSAWQRRAWATGFVVLCYWAMRDVFYLIAYGLAFGEPYWGFTVGALSFVSVPMLLAYFLVLEGM